MEVHSLRQAIKNSGYVQSQHHGGYVAFFDGFNESEFGVTIERSGSLADQGHMVNIPGGDLWTNHAEIKLSIKVAPEEIFPQ